MKHFKLDAPLSALVAGSRDLAGLHEDFRADLDLFETGASLIDVLFRYQGDLRRVHVEGASIVGAPDRRHRDGVATATLPAARLKELTAHDEVLFIESARRLEIPGPGFGPGGVGSVFDDCGPESSFDPSGPRFIGSERLRARRPDLDGLGVVIGIIDGSVDPAHPALRKVGADGRPGSTRIERLWVQDPDPAAPPGLGAVPRPWKYGREYAAAEIDRLLASGATSKLFAADDDLRHGTSVASLAAGNGAGQQGKYAPYVGVAPGATIVFVALRPSGTGAAGDMRAFADALHFISRRAGNRPCVINVSAGDGLGPHDGSSLVERRIDHLCNHPGRVVVIAAGNANDRGKHAEGVIESEPSRLELFNNDPPLGAAPLSESFQIWYEPPARLELLITAPNGETAAVRPGTQFVPLKMRGVRLLVSSLLRGGRRSRHLIEVVMSDVPADDKAWQFTLKPLTGHGTHWHAWIDNFTSGVRWSAPFRRERMTLITPATCRRGLVAGFFDISDTSSRNIDHNSGVGPTQDGRHKPEIGAPGNSVRAARAGTDRYCETFGSSMAAPLVTGAAALTLQCLRGRAGVDDVREILRRCCDAALVGGSGESCRWGALNIGALDHVCQSYQQEKRRRHAPREREST